MNGGVKEGSSEYSRLEIREKANQMQRTERGRSARMNPGCLKQRNVIDWDAASLLSMHQENARLADNERFTGREAEVPPPHGKDAMAARR